MDQFLPTEILAQIASNLSRKDFNSLSRTSRTALWKLEPYREPLRIEVLIRSDDFLDMVSPYGRGLRLEVHLKQERGLRCFKSILFNSLTDADITYSEEKKKTEVQGFYYRNRENPLNWHNAETTFLFGIKEGLSEHLHFLLSHKVVIDQLLCNPLHEADFSELAEQIRRHGTRVNELVWGDQCNLDIMTAIDPISLKIICFTMPTEFYQSELVRKVAQLSVSSHEAILQEGDLPALTATSIEIENVKGVTVNDIQCFLKQWLESRRQIEFLNLQMNVDEPISTWRAMFSQLKIRPLGFDGIKSEIRIPIHRCDGQKIYFRSVENERIVYLST